MSQEPITSLATYFGGLEDPRTGNNIQHPLINIITIAICGVVSGAASWVDVEEYGYAKQAFFETCWDLRAGIPSHDTFGRVFRGLDPDAFSQWFSAWTQRICEVTTGEVVAFDGKCLRGSNDSAHERDGLDLVSACSTM